MADNDAFDVSDSEITIVDDIEENEEGICNTNIIDITLINKHPNLQGFGLDISGGTDRPYHPQDNGIFVSAIRPRGLAERSGQLDKGDKILQVNGTSVSSVTHEEAVKLFIADRGKVELRLHKAYDVLLRAAASTPSPTPSPVMDASVSSETPLTTSTEIESPKKENCNSDGNSSPLSLPGFAIGLALGCLCVVVVRRYLVPPQTT